MKPLEPGTLVALQSHPLHYGISFDNLVLHGEPDSIPPVLVVGEVLMHVKGSFGEQFGEEIATKGSYSYRCYWYSLKTREFKDQWFHHKHLSAILSEKPAASTKENQNVSDESILKVGSLMVLKSASIEIRKIKATLRYNDDFSTKPPALSANLSYIAPVMEIVGFVKDESKEPRYDIKSGDRIRFKAERMVKCRYFDGESNKFSEVQLPEKVLERIATIDNGTLHRIESAINNKNYLAIKSGDSISQYILPKKLAFLGGVFMVYGIDYFSGKMEIYELSEFCSSGFCRDEKFKLPDFKKDDKEIIFYEVEFDAISSNLSILTKNCFVEIQYVNRIKKLSTRVLNLCEFIPTFKDDKSVDYFWMHGYCLNKKDYRSFKSTNIVEIKFVTFLPCN